MKKKIVITLVAIIILITVTTIYIMRPIKIKKILYITNEKEITAVIELKGNLKNSTCAYNGTTNKIENNTCKIIIPNEEAEITIESKFHTKKITLNPNINKIIDLTLNTEKVYLKTNEEKEITFSLDKLGNPEENITLISSDDAIVKTENNKIIGISSGQTKVIVKIEDITKEIDVTVTDLITTPIWKGQDKSLLPCNIYTEEEANLLDKYLEYEIETAGYQTRAGAVAAARFLTLEFKYRIPYFYENGRINNTGVHKADGEGRYYKKGLYLSESKKNNIIASWKGPAIWGCPLRNLEDEPQYGFTMGAMKPNGLDCSGFVSWTLVQAGFDPGDVGAGESEGYQLTDTGKFTRLSKSLLDSGKIKVGDLFNYWGHISILIGINGDDLYIAESLPPKKFDGVTVKHYTKSNVMNTFDYVVLMDNFYKEDGNLTNYWE